MIGRTLIYTVQLWYAIVGPDANNSVKSSEELLQHLWANNKQELCC